MASFGILLIECGFSGIIWHGFNWNVAVVASFGMVLIGMWLCWHNLVWFLIECGFAGIIWCGFN